MLIQKSLLAIVTLIACHAQAAELLWIEAESSPRTSMASDLKQVDDPNLSGGSWFNGKVREGLFAEYDLEIMAPGKYELFARRFWMHGAFRWRIGDHPWATIAEGQRILDSVAIGSQPASWTSLGCCQLEPGRQVLRIEMLTDTGYKWSSVYAFDCFVLTDGMFTPKGLSREVADSAVLDDPAEFGKQLDRTLTLLEQSTPTRRMPVRILFYGQSIVANSHIAWHLPDSLRERYPDAVIQSKKLAIGGYEAPRLKKTAWYDVYPEYPDLVVFHVYGGEDDGSLEEIFAGIKRYTTAEVLTWTHHMDNFNAAMDLKRDAASEFRRGLAKRYGCEMADVRELWKDHLKTTHTIAKNYLTDMIHLNSEGSKLLLQFLKPHFTRNANASQEWRKRVTTLDLARANPQVSYEPGSWKVTDAGLVNTGTSPLTIVFTGNKLEVERGAAGATAGKAALRLDGKLPSTDKDAFTATRPDIVPGGWWPCIDFIQIGDKPVLQDYTVTFFNFGAEAKTYAYRVQGDVTGDEGGGNEKTAFSARSGDVGFSPEDIHFAKQPPSPEFVAHFRIRSMHRDQIEGLAREHATVVDRLTVLQTRDNRKHLLEIIPEAPGAICLKSLTVHCP